MVSKPSCQEQLKEKVPTNKIKYLLKIKLKEHRLNIHVVCSGKNLMHTSHTIKNVSIFCEGNLGLINEKVNMRAKSIGKNFVMILMTVFRRLMLVFVVPHIH